MGRHSLNLNGKTFGKLLVLCPMNPVISPVNEVKYTTWKVRCECGKEEVTTTKYLRDKYNSKTDCDDCRYKRISATRIRNINNRKRNKK